MNMLFRVERNDIQRMLDVLAAAKYRVVGPTVRDGAIIYDDVRHAADFPIGWTDEQAAGSYRLKRRDDAAMFGYVVGPHSWKKYLFAPHKLLYKAHREDAGVRFVEAPADDTKFALIGVRSCELHAIAIQDRVFMGLDRDYRSIRQRLFIVAVNCGMAGGTCFCDSMNTGPHARDGFDLALTEMLDGGSHYFLVQVGSKAGEEVLSHIPHRAASVSESAQIEKVRATAISQMGRRMDTSDIKALLYRNYENPRWAQIADRCLACANCTMSCPTCFCSTIEDTNDLTGDHAERWRRWESCFTTDFSQIHGGSIRSSTKSKYRQWMTHKLATWIDQFDVSGCVGCGRCITWCPVGIDITEEVRAIRESETVHANRNDR